MSKRGCGDSREECGIYAESRLAEYGKPLESFLIDYPIPLSALKVSVPRRGVLLFDDNCRCLNGRMSSGATCIACAGRGRLTHVLDWIGEKFYPTPADFLEEARVLGVSRKLSPALNYERLTLGSRLVQIHAKALIENYEPLYVAESDYKTATGLFVKRCPLMAKPHEPQNIAPGNARGYCARLHWQTLEEKGSELIATSTVNKRLVKRQLACEASYGGLLLPEIEGYEPQFAPAIFAWFPITNLAVIQSTNKALERERLEKAKASTLPVSLEEE